MNKIIGELKRQASGEKLPPEQLKGHSWINDIPRNQRESEPLDTRRTPAKCQEKK
jgi:hypothetical protein